MAFNIEEFTGEARAKGFSDTQIKKFLSQKGIDETLPERRLNLLRRAALSFGDTAAQEEADRLEKQAGLKGRFDLGDIADIVGEIPTFIGAGLGAAGGAIGGVGVGAAPGSAIGALAGEGVKRTIGQALGVRGSKSGFEEASGALGVGALTLGTGAVLNKVLPAAKIASGGVARTAVRPVTGIAEKGTELLLGSSGKRAVARSFKNPELVQSFLTSKRTIQNTADDVISAVYGKGGIQETTKAAFDKAESNLANKVISNDTVVGTLDDYVNNFFGTQGGDIAFEQTGLTVSEQGIVRKAMELFESKALRDGKVTTRSLLDAKRAIQNSRFYKGDGAHNSSDAFITGLNKQINNMIADADPVFAKATQQARQDIELLDKLGFSLRGSKNTVNVEATANRLRSLARNIDDPQRNVATKELIAEISRRTGLNLSDELSSFQTSEIISQDISGLGSPLRTLQQEITKGASAVSRTAGKLFNGVENPTNPGFIQGGATGSSASQVEQNTPDAGENPSVQNAVKKINFKDGSINVGGVSVDATGAVGSIDRVAGKAAKTSLAKFKNISNEDLGEVLDFIDSIRVNKSLKSIDTEIAVRRLAERFGLNANLSPSKLANKFADLIEQTPEVFKSAMKQGKAAAVIPFITGEEKKSPESEVTVLDVLKEVPGVTADILGSIGAEILKTPVRVGASLVDIPRVAAGKEPLQPVNVPVLGEASSAQREAVDRIEGGESTVGAVLGAGGESILDVIALAGVTQSVINKLKGTIKPVAPKTTPKTAVKSNADIAQQLQREQVIKQAQEGLRQSAQGINTSNIGNSKSFGDLVQNQFQKNAVMQLKANGDDILANELSRIDLSQAQTVDDVITQLVGEFGKDKVFGSMDLKNHINFIRGLLTEIDPSRIGNILLP